jgi:CRP/FNR family transcriptional regulator, cyclic AMP receptor protein
VGIWEAVDARGTAVRFAAGDVLFHHGDSTRHCYAIRSGEVLVTVSSTQGSTVVLARRGPGTVVGEQAALDGAPRSATVRAATDVDAVVLDAAQLESLLREQPEIALAELTRLSRQLREMSERYALRSEELRTRLLGLLATHFSATGEMAFRSTREELAGWVGATREAVTRTLRELEADGIVRLHRGAVELVDARAVRA